MAVDWLGDKMKARMGRASIVGVNQTMAEAVVYAKKNHAFTNRSSTAEKSIRIQTASRYVNGIVSGIWGSVSIKYFAFLEYGTKLTKSRTSIRQRTRLMKTGVLKRPLNAGAPPWQGGSYAPTLAPAAVVTYPNLAQKIKAAYGG